MNYGVVGLVLAGLWCLVLVLDWIQTFIIGSERVARVLCKVFSNRVLSLLIYWLLYTITAIVLTSFSLDFYTQIGWEWMLLEVYIEIPISWLIIPIFVYVHTDRMNVRARWLDHKLRRSGDLETSVKALLMRIDNEPDSSEAKRMTDVLTRISRSGDTFGYNVGKIIEGHRQE